jgi:hypothetical protein
MPRGKAAIRESEIKAGQSIAAIGQIKKVSNCRKEAFTYKEVTIHIPTNAGVLKYRDRLTLDSFYEGETYINISMEETQPPAELIPPADNDGQGNLEVD